MVTGKFSAKVFGWMGMGIGISAMTAHFAIASGLAAALGGWALALFVLQVLIVIGIGFATATRSSASFPLSIGLFALFSATIGVTLSTVINLYTAVSVAQVFLVACMTFGFMFVYGWTTKRDLTSMGSLLMMTLFGLILGSLLNAFVFQSGVLGYVFNVAGILIFVGFTAYDAQNIKEMEYNGFENEDDENRMAVMMGLNVYMNLVNLFINMLGLFGEEK